MTKPKFVRQNTARHSRLGKRRKKLQKWRKPKGRDSKMRLKRKSYSSTVKIGYKSSLKNKKPILIHNLKELEKIGKDGKIILSKIGAKKKLEIISAAEKRKIEIINIGGKK